MPRLQSSAQFSIPERIPMELPAGLGDGLLTLDDLQHQRLPLPRGPSLDSFHHKAHWFFSRKITSQQEITGALHALRTGSSGTPAMYAPLPDTLEAGGTKVVDARLFF
jgi:hypothetical protein